MHITISDDINLAAFSEAVRSIDCRLVNDGQGGLIVQKGHISGDCELCGDWSGELKAGACPVCTTRHGL